MKIVQTTRFPDFLGIGAARSGTTWISSNLSKHPNIWIPRIKELHYFTRSSKYFGPSQLEDANFFRRMLYRGAPYKKYRLQLVKSIGSNILKPSLSKLKWDFNYLFGIPSDQWYAGLFNQGAGKTTGEITPRYCSLDTCDIRALKKLIPNVKLIFIMRDPVERAWSLIRYHEHRQKDNRTNLPVEKLKKIAVDPAITTQSEYDKILDRWCSVFPSEQFFTAFYDEIVDHPNELLKRLLEFLGLDFNRMPAEQETKKKKKINASFEKEIPEELRLFLVDLYMPMLTNLSNQYGGYFTNWLDRYL